MAAHTSFLVYDGFKWAKRATFLALICTVAYIWYEPLPNRNGGTWVGYPLGGLGALIILWLTWLGVKKRGFRGGSHTLKAWTSAHVYLGLSLIVIGTLHSGFEFGWNIHTLAYALMMVVILSGLYGVFAYARYPMLMSENRAGVSAVELRKEMADIDARLARLSQKLPDAFADTVRSSIQDTRIGGRSLALLSGSSKSCATAQALRDARDKAGEFAGAASEADVAQLLSNLARKADIAEILRRDIAFKAAMDVWLWLHVPFTIGLIAALIAHVVVVFFYW